MKNNGKPKPVRSILISSIDEAQEADAQPILIEIKQVGLVLNQETGAKFVVGFQVAKVPIPLVLSGSTSRTVLFPWQHLVDLAKARGIDDVRAVPDNLQEGKMKPQSRLILPPEARM